jgi:hypothetical protein
MDDSEKVGAARSALERWINQQGHERCWYYPEIFNELVQILGVEQTAPSRLPPLAEFRQGCRRYQEEEFGQEYFNASADSLRDMAIHPEFDKVLSLLPATETIHVGVFPAYMGSNTPLGVEKWGDSLKSLGNYLRDKRLEHLVDYTNPDRIALQMTVEQIKDLASQPYVGAIFPLWDPASYTG